jgi:archaeosine-15-forming tRNA-guanine transglycosylase
LIREIGQRDGGVDLQEVGLELLSVHHADGLRVPGRRSARRLSANSLSRFSCVLIRLSFDPFGRVLLVAQGLADSPRGEAGQSVRRGRSVFLGAVLKVREAISDSPQ